MALSDTQIQTIIKNEVGGDIDFGGTPEHAVELDVSLYWENNAMFSATPRLRQAQTKVDCIRFLLGQLRYLTDAGIQDLNPQVGGRFRNLEALEREALADVDTWKKWYAQQRPNIIRQNPNVAPLEPCYEQPDANDRRLRGDAILPPFFRG